MYMDVCKHINENKKNINMENGTFSDSTFSKKFLSFISNYDRLNFTIR